MAKVKKPSAHISAQNRKARHDYFIEQNYEAGIMLSGSEVKSLRAGRATITEANKEAQIAQRKSSMRVRSCLGFNGKTIFREDFL